MKTWSPILLAIAASGSAAAFTPEAQEVLDILGARIAAAQAGQASRETFLDALESPESGCADWAGQEFWQQDPDLRAAVEEACPDLRRHHVPRRVRPFPSSLGLSASHSVRPADEGPRDPSLSARGRHPWGGAEAAGTGTAWRRRRAWLGRSEASPGSLDSPGFGWTLQAGSLEFESLDPDPDGRQEPGRRTRPGRNPALPRLDFLTGRRAFPGISTRSGLDGPLEARSPALDGLGLSAGGLGALDWETGAFAAWNRRPASGEGPEAAPRLDLSVLSLAAGLTGGSWFAAAQAAQVRMETAGSTPVTAWMAGGALGPASGRLRLGAAASALWPRGSPWEVGAGSAGNDSTGVGSTAVGSSGAGSPEASSSDARFTEGLSSDARSSGGSSPGTRFSGTRSPVTGAYGEVVLAEGKPGGYLLELRQATPDWAGPLSAAPAFTRDTVEEAMILPGRGEGGLRARTRLDILAAGPGAPWDAALTASGEAGWDPNGLLAGDGRLGLALRRGPWGLEGGMGLRWRREGLSQAGSFRAGSVALAWTGAPWRARVSLSRQLAGKDWKETWPLSLEAARTGQDGSRWKAEIRCADAAKPSRDARLSVRQSWRLGGGFDLTHSLRLPWEGGEPGQDLGYQVRLDYDAL